MADAWQAWGRIVVVSALAVPFAALIVMALTWVRTRPARKNPLPRVVAVRRSVAEVGVIIGTLPWLWMILTPGAGPRRVHLVPLVEIVSQVTGDPQVAVVQIGGNLLVFFSLGVFGPLRFPALRSPLRLLALGAAGSVLVETLQWVLDLGRVSAVDDVLLNALGAMLGGLASRRRWRDGSRGTPVAPSTRHDAAGAGMDAICPGEDGIQGSGTDGIRGNSGSAGD